MKKVLIVFTVFLLSGCNKASSVVREEVKEMPSSAVEEEVEENTTESYENDPALDNYVCVLSYVGNEKDGLERVEYTYEFDDEYQIIKCERIYGGIKEEVGSLENEFDIQKQYEYYKKGCSVLKYDESGKLLHFDNDSCEEGGGSTDFEYDANGNLVMVMTKDAKPVHYEYLTIRDYLAGKMY